MPHTRPNQIGVMPWDDVLRMSGMESNTDALEEKVRKVMPLSLESHNNRDRHSNTIISYEISREIVASGNTKSLSHSSIDRGKYT